MGCSTDGCAGTGRLVRGLCGACYSRAQYAANREKRQAQARARRLASPEKQRAADAAWYAKNGETKKAEKRAKQAAETPKQRTARLAYAKAYNPAYYEKNAEKLITVAASWGAANPKRRSELNKASARRNPDSRRAFKQNRRARECGAGGSFTKQEWQELCTVFGNRCPACNRTDVKLTADHIVPVSLGGSSNIDNIQPLCGPCNSSKGARIIHYCSL